MPVAIHKQFFPDCFLSCFQQDIIEQSATDLDRWRETCYFWAANGYRGQSILKMLDHYKNQKPDFIQAAIKEFADKDARLVEIAVIQTMMTTEAKIGSVNYFRPAIDRMYFDIGRAKEKVGIVMPDYVIDGVLQKRRQQWQKAQ